MSEEIMVIGEPLEVAYTLDGVNAFLLQAGDALIAIDKTTSLAEINATLRPLRKRLTLYVETKLIGAAIEPSDEYDVADGSAGLQVASPPAQTSCRGAEAATSPTVPPFDALETKQQLAGYVAETCSECKAQMIECEQCGRVLCDRHWDNHEHEVKRA
jgi:hypothetical protein